MKEQEGDQKDILQIIEANVKPAVKVVAAGASGMAAETSGVVGMFLRRRIARVTHDFYRWQTRRRLGK